MSGFVQIGFTALRDPDGNFCPIVPLYIEATPEVRESEAAAIKDISKVFADRMKRYIEAGGLIGDADKEDVKKRKKAVKSGEKRVTP